MGGGPDSDGFVGYRVRERLGSISAPNDVVGRSPAVSGTVTISGGALTGAEVVSLRLPGTLTLHGVARPVEFPVEARWDGPTIQVAGGTRVRRADFGLEVPNLVGYRIEDTGVVELELTLVRKGASLAGPVSTLRRSVAVPQGGGGEPGRSTGEPCRGGRRLPGGDGRLLFTAITDRDEEHLFTIGADGRGLRRVGADTAGELEPTWSPDGRRIAYVKDGAIHVMRADGSADRPLTRGGKDAAPAWSPDGTRLTFVRDGNLHLVRADGAGTACVRTGMLLTSGARWRPSPP